jgi:hypothetical protein
MSPFADLAEVLGCSSRPAQFLLWRGFDTPDQLTRIPSWVYERE